MLIHSAGQEFCRVCGKTLLLLMALLRSFTDTKLMGGLVWKTQDGFSHRLVPWGMTGELELVTQCPRVASLAWPSQGSWISSVVTIFLQRECSKITTQKLICFCDLLSEFIWCYFCHTLCWSKQPWTCPDSSGEEKAPPLDGGVTW